MTTTNAKSFTSTATKVAMVSILGNIVLSIFKLFAGIVAHSGAMISDAVHSASDVFSTIIVIIGIKISSKASDKEHPYGHERLECIAALLLSGILLATGLGIGYHALDIIFQKTSQKIVIPGILALIAAILSILVKEGMFQYTKYYALKLDSGALLADAWHHRSDALSSIGALAGILGARMGFPPADSIASILICLFIAKAAYDIFKDAVDKMVDHACDARTEQELTACICAIEGVLHIDVLRTRVFGAKIYVDVEISADGAKTLSESHKIAEKVHDTIENNFPKVKHVMVHVNPHTLHNGKIID